jgi:lipopolysaccharide biosynthesis glycosyltransferase
MFKKIEHISVETYFKLFLPSILKVSKILYLDVDLIVVGDLADLYTHQLGTFSIAARTYDNSLKWVVERNLSNGLPEEHNYFNAGVLLLDLDLLRRNKYFEKAINLVLQDNNINDQDALNRIVKNDFSELQAKYNWTLHQKDSKEEPVIIHFPGKYKPITFGYVHPYSTLYSKLANEVLLKNYKIFDFKYLFYYRFKILIWSFLNAR